MAKTYKVKSTTEGRQPLDLGMLPQLAGFILHQAEVVISRDYKAATAATGLTRAQFAMLEIVSCNPKVLQVELSTQLAMDKATTMVMVDRLEAGGLLRRRASTIDRRRQEVHVTPKGEDLLVEIRRLALAHEAALFAHIPPAEIKRLMRTLKKICAPFNQPAERLLAHAGFGLPGEEKALSETARDAIRD